MSNASAMIKKKSCSYENEHGTCHRFSRNSFEVNWSRFVSLENSDLWHHIMLNEYFFVNEGFVSTLMFLDCGAKITVRPLWTFLLQSYGALYK